MNDCVGALEIHVDGCWLWMVRTESLLRSDSDLLGSLFGIDNLANFRPLFQNRELPEDLSKDFAASLEGLRSDGARINGASWMSLSEMRLIPWDEEALDFDSRIHRYEIVDDIERYVGKALSYPDPLVAELRRGGEQSVRTGNTVYRRRKLRRTELLDGSDFPVLVDVAELLGARYGAACVRWVVVFAE